MALMVYSLGLLIGFTRSFWEHFATQIAELGKSMGPDRLYTASLQWLRRLANRWYGHELRDLARRLSSILLPAALLVGAGLAVTPTGNAFKITPVNLKADSLSILVLLVVLMTTVVTAVVRNHLTQVLALSAISFALIAVFALAGAPDVALVAALITSISTLLFVGVFALFPKGVLRRQENRPHRRATQARQTAISIISGIFAFLIVWSTLSVAPVREGVMETYMRLSEAAHGQDVVTVILADFRGLDTAGEITVVMIALVGVATLLRKGKMR
jgi:multicomponent Na+:H+ antiporter subunit A